MLVIRTTGPTGWAPGTKKYVLYDHKTGTKPLAVACAANAREVRECPPTSKQFAAVEALAWKASGAPLQCVAIVVVTKKGWEWVPYNGNKTWAKKNYLTGT